jgi:hypothetical protein
MRAWIALWVGSSCLSTHIAAWLLGGGAWAITGKLLLGAIAAGIVKGLPHTTSIVALSALAWTALAIAYGLAIPVTVTMDTPDESAEPAAEKTAEEADEEPPALTPERLVQALHEVGAPHAHTSALAEHLDAPAEAVREALRAAGIPLTGGVRMKGREVAVSPGVKQGDFPPLPSPDPAAAEEAPVAGVLTSNNNSNNTDQPDPGEAPTIVQDENNPHRWRVLRARS